jgi:hypothetical protein
VTHRGGRPCCGTCQDTGGRGPTRCTGTRSGTGSRDTEFPAHASGAGPALIVYRDPNGTEDQLMCVHRGFGSKSAPALTSDAQESASTAPGPADDAAGT